MKSMLFWSLLLLFGIATCGGGGERRSDIADPTALTAQIVFVENENGSQHVNTYQELLPQGQKQREGSWHLSRELFP